MSWPAYRLSRGQLCRQDVQGGDWTELPNDTANQFLDRVVGVAREAQEALLGLAGDAGDDTDQLAGRIHAAFALVEPPLAETVGLYRNLAEQADPTPALALDAPACLRQARRPQSPFADWPPGDDPDQEGS